MPILANGEVLKRDKHGFWKTPRQFPTKERRPQEERTAPWHPRARKLGLYFMTFSMLGHWVEMLFCTGIKYGVFKGGYDRENHMLWDYRDMRFHFMGQVCLQNSLFYSIIATWGVWQLLPALEKLMKKAGDTTLDGILVGMGSVFLFLELLYQAVPPKKKDDGNGEPDTASSADKAKQSHIVDSPVPGTGE